MSRQANPTAIGAFVVGAIILLAAGVALFGGSELFASRNHYEAYFEEQTKGLRVGSNVVLNGVRIGYVSQIALLIDEDEFATLTRVTLEVLPEAYIPVRNGVRTDDNLRDVITHDELIRKAGLRAQLEIESFVTGQLLVSLAFRPDTPVQMSGMRSRHPEIPTIPSDIQQMLLSIQDWLAELRSDVDVGSLTDRITEALRAFTKLMDSEALHTTLAGLSTLVNDSDTQELSGSLRSALAEVSAAASEAQRLFASADDDLDTLSADLVPVLERLDQTLSTADDMLGTFQQQLSGETEQAYQLHTTLREVEGAAAALREFFDYIERNPEALIKGKSE